MQSPGPGSQDPAGAPAQCGPHAPAAAASAAPASGLTSAAAGRLQNPGRSRARIGRRRGELEQPAAAESAHPGREAPLQRVPLAPGAEVYGSPSWCKIPNQAWEEMDPIRAQPCPAVARSPKIYDRPRPFLEKSYFPGFREIVMTPILNLEARVHLFQGGKKDVKKVDLTPGNMGPGTVPVPGFLPPPRTLLAHLR